MLLNGGRSSSIMRALWVFILCSNFVKGLENDGSGFRNCSSEEALSKDFNCTIVKGNLSITKSVASLHNLETIKQIDGIIKIEGTDLDSISFPVLTSFGKTDDKEPALMIIDNPQLTSIDFPKLEKAETASTKVIVVKGNKKFNKADSLYQKFSKVSGDKILEIECYFKNEISKLSQLNGCTMVSGDLILKGTVEDSSHKITRIDGCLKMVDTSLKDLSFLNLTQSQVCSTESEISGNKELCLSWPIVKELREKIGKINYKPDESCDIVCSLSEFEELTACNGWEGDLTVAGLDSNNGQGSALAKVMANVKRITGKLTISGNKDSTIEFPELVSVGNSSLSDETILIDGNENLKGLAIPKLKSIETDGRIAIVVKGLKMTKDQVQFFKNVAGEKEFKLECDFSNTEVKNFTELDYCTSIKGALFLKGTQGVLNATIESIGGCLKVIDTSLKDLSFLNLDQSPACSTEAEISGNKNLCLSWPYVKELAEKIGKIKYERNGDCDTPCSLSGFGEFSACNILEGDLSITGLDSNNGQETTLSTIMAKVKRITGKLTISGNSDSNIEFPELVSVGNSSLSGESILIDGNENLNQILIPKLSSVETNGSIAIVVKGFKMTKDQAQFLKNASGEKRFKFECDFSNTEIKDFTELDYCTSIKGDLLLNGTQGILNTTVKSIGGCVRVINTNLNKDAFLSLVSPLQSETCPSGEKSEVKGNKNLCLTWSEMKKVRKTFGKIVELSFDESCEFPCTKHEFGEDGSYCDQINGELYIVEDRDSNATRAIFEKVKRVKGSIRIIHSSLEEIEFKSLSVIDNSERGWKALYLRGNEKLRKLSMPKLKTINSSDPEAVLITMNDGFRISNEFKNTLETAMTPGGGIIYECHESNEISDFSRLEVCTRMSSELLLKGNISKNPPKSKIGHIEGCLNVENTNLSSLDFLKIDETSGVLEFDIDTGFRCRDEHFIRNNENLCIPPFLEQQLKKIYPKLNITDNKPRDQCPVFCTAVNGTIPDHECSIVNGELTIENNCSFDQNLALVERIHGELVVKDCSLSSLGDLLPKLRNISSSGIPLTLENIENYGNLTDFIQFTLESENLEEPLLKIVTNEEIPYMVVADLKANFGSKRIDVSKIQQIPDGVCVFVDPPVEVKNCNTVEGDLVLNEKSVSVSPDLTEITGCLVVMNTNMENYEFLTKIEKVGGNCRWNTGETDIFNNSCIPYDVRGRTTGKVKKLVEKEENKKECYECIGGVIPSLECKVVIGNLQISQSSPDEVEKQLESVEEIYGRLIIKNSSLAQLSLTQLTKIDATESEEPAIEITGNNELSILQMPSLINITSKGKVVVKIEENKKLNKTVELVEKLGKSAECGEGKDGACQFFQVKIQAKPAATAQTTTEEEGVPDTVLMASVVIYFTILIVGVVGTVVLVVRIKKQRAAAKRELEMDQEEDAVSTIDTMNIPELSFVEEEDNKSSSKETMQGDGSKEPTEELEQRASEKGTSEYS